MVYQILIKVVQKHESHSLVFQIMPFTENTLALANMCLVIHVIHVMGIFFQYYERIVVLKHISGNLLLQRVHP